MHQVAAPVILEPKSGLGKLRPMTISLVLASYPLPPSSILSIRSVLVILVYKTYVKIFCGQRGSLPPRVSWRRGTAQGSLIIRQEVPSKHHNPL
jgi:hypothetical protein